MILRRKSGRRITVLEENPVFHLLRVEAAGNMDMDGEHMVVNRGKHMANHILVGKRNSSRKIYIQVGLHFGSCS